MIKPMTYRDVARTRRGAGFTPHPGKGDHEKWIAPSGHHVTIRHQQEAAPGIVKQALSAIEGEKNR